MSIEFYLPLEDPHDRDVPEDDASADDGSEMVYVGAGRANTDEFRPDEPDEPDEEDDL